MPSSKDLSNRDFMPQSVVHHTLFLVCSIPREAAQVFGSRLNLMETIRQYTRHSSESTNGVLSISTRTRLQSPSRNNRKTANPMSAATLIFQNGRRGNGTTSLRLGIASGTCALF